MITPELEQYVEYLRAALRADCEGRDFDGVMLVANTHSSFYRPGTMTREVYTVAAVLAARDLGVASAHQAIVALSEFEEKARSGWLKSVPASAKPPVCVEIAGNHLPSQHAQSVR